MLDYGLKDKTAIVTGANNPQGIGAATALAFDAKCPDEGRVCIHGEVVEE